MDTNKNFSFLNKVELIGVVGANKITEIANRRLINMAVVTNSAYMDIHNNACIDTKWHNVVAFESPKVKDIDKIEKGTVVHLSGRLRDRRYISNNGEQKLITEIVVAELEILGNRDELRLDYETNDNKN